MRGARQRRPRGRLPRLGLAGLGLAGLGLAGLRVGLEAVADWGCPGCAPDWYGWAGRPGGGCAPNEPGGGGGGYFARLRPARRLARVRRLAWAATPGPAGLRRDAP